MEHEGRDLLERLAQLESSQTEFGFAELLQTAVRLRLGIQQTALDPGQPWVPLPYLEEVENARPERPIARSIPVTIYLSDSAAHSEVQQSVTELLSALEFEVVDVLEPVEGSWYRALVARLRQALTADELADRLQKVERGVELHLLHKKQAEIDSLQAEAVARLLTALESTPSALIQIGSVLLVKVDGVPAVRNLTQQELRYLERNPGLLRNPAKIFDALDSAVRNPYPVPPS